MTGLLSFENHYPDQMLGGMKQRVGIVRALATSPQVLLMDEPFGALDSQTRAVMQEILTNMWQQLQLSVLFITHDIEEAIFLSEKVYVMTARPGRIKAEIPKKTLEVSCFIDLAHQDIGVGQPEPAGEKSSFARRQPVMRLRPVIAQHQTVHEQPPLDGRDCPGNPGIRGRKKSDRRQQQCTGIE